MYWFGDCIHKQIENGRYWDRTRKQRSGEFPVAALAPTHYVATDT